MGPNLRLRCIRVEGTWNRPLERKLARVHLVVEQEGHSRGFRGIRAYDGAKDAASVVERGRGLGIIQPGGREGTFPAEPREVLPVPVVACVVVVVRVVVPEPKQRNAGAIGGVRDMRAGKHRRELT